MKKTNTKKTTKPDDVSAISNIRVRNGLRKSINEKVELLNKRKKGSKKIIPSDLIELAYSLLSEDHFEQILEQTINGSDRRKIARKNYIKKHGDIKEDAFFDLIQEHEIEINDYLPEEFRSHKSPENKDLTINNNFVINKKRSA